MDGGDVDMKELLKQEKQLRNSINSIGKFVSGFKVGVQENQIEVRLETLEGAMRKFYSVRRKIELLAEEEEDEDETADSKETAAARTKRLATAAAKRDAENSEIVEMVEEQYFETKAGLIALRPKVIVPPASTSPRTAEPVSRVKLPDIKLPSFSGKVKDWVTFRDTFRSLIHSNQTLPAVDKFTYLRASLSGDALQDISSVELSANNYDVAWKILEKKYENKKLIVKAHLDAMFAVEPMRKENPEALNRVIGEFDKNLQMLRKIGEETEHWSTILAHMVCARLDSATLRLWESHHNSKEVPKYEQLIDFLRDHYLVLQTITPEKPSEKDFRRPRLSVTHTSSQQSSQQRQCLFCGDSYHMPFKCSKMKSMTVPQRVEEVNRKRLCRNCLTGGHFAEGCSKGSCTRCGRKHHTMLHFDSPSSVPRSSNSSVPQTHSRPQAAGHQQPQQNQTRPQTQTQTTPTQPATQTTNSYPVTQAPMQNTHTPPATEQRSTVAMKAVQLPSHITTPLARQVLMSTAIVRVEDDFGNASYARALLDSCSEFCYVTSSFTKRLRLRETPYYLKVQGIGDACATSTKFVDAFIRPRLAKISSFVEDMRFHVLSKITRTLPISPVNVAQWPLPSDIVLADPTFWKPGPIDMIIGAEYYFDLLTAGRKKPIEDGPTLQETVLGWVVSGKVPENSDNIPRTSSYVSSAVNLQDLISKFWELEACHVNSINSLEETACEKFFNETTVRDAEGRFVVTLPKKEHMMEKLGESRSVALKRFYGMEKRLNSNPELRTMYTEFIHEYLLMGHMKEVEESCSSPVYYLTHHAVLKPDSTTTKLRVVFDASCRTSTGVSLNDALMVGPVVQDDLLSIILRFRTHRFVVTADVAKMYRMVRVQEADQHLQRILWRDSVDEPVKTYELTTVTYGTASAPYLATKCLQKLGEDSTNSHPIAARVIQKDFYVDDMLSGADSEDEAKQLVDEVVEVTNSAGFMLRKWNSNSKSLLQHLPKNLIDERATLEFDASSATVKTLGLRWDTRSDRFCFSFPQWRSTVSAITKRSIHSDAACLFDPLGLVGPVIVQAKIIIQQLWRLKCDWDDPLDEGFQNVWKEYKQNLIALESLSVPRWIGFSKNCVAIQIHGFCDASQAAYGACLYLRSIAEDGTITVQLITSKSRIAPLEHLERKKKAMTIPRLELSSALLLSHLFEKFSKVLPVSSAFFWTDSMIVKHWLASHPSRWQAFVATRVSEIQHLTKDGFWNHVAGTENPADLISRGMSPAQLQYQTLWFEGPRWLSQDQSNWPSSEEAIKETLDSSLLEERTTKAFPARAVPPNEIFELSSSYRKLIRIVALLLRAKHNLQQKNHRDRRTDMLSHAELEQALLVLVRQSQQDSFPEEVHDLVKHGEVKNTSRIKALNPQFRDGVMRVGGRLSNAPVPENRKHPFILDHHHPFAVLVVRHYHQAQYHAGQQLLIASVRGKFWPINIHNLARRVIHECVACFRSKPRSVDQIMADLPSDRVNPAPPFLKVGVDYCGPFFIKFPNRKASPVKCYVAIFVCLVVKAVHLELVFDLTSQAFLAALRRFVGNYGVPELITCDNATTFVGARRELMELYRLFHSRQFQETVQRTASNEGIQFRFIPPQTPSFGGLWEAQVKSFKNHFKKVVGLRTLDVSEMWTALAQIKAVLNSRPLTPLSSDPSDFEALTPGHFIAQRPLTAIPEPNLDGVPSNCLTLWESAQELTQQLWRKWSTYYLSDLQSRSKWRCQRNNITVGTMVLIKDKNAPPLKWHLGRVTKIFHGTDGNVRVVTVRTKDGCFDRGITKICPLPIRDNSPQEN